MTRERVGVVRQFATQRARSRLSNLIAVLVPCQETSFAECVATVQLFKAAIVVATVADAAPVFNFFFVVFVVLVEVVKDRVTARHLGPRSLVLVVFVVVVTNARLIHRDDVKEVLNGPQVRVRGLYVVLFIGPPGVPLVVALTSKLARAELAPGTHNVDELPQSAEPQLVQNVIHLLHVQVVRQRQALSHSALAFGSLEYERRDDTRAGHEGVANLESRECRVVV